MISFRILCLLFIVCPKSLTAFTHTTGFRQKQLKTAAERVRVSSRGSKTYSSSLFKSSIKDNDVQSPSDNDNTIKVSFVYASAWIGFVTFALFGTPEAGLAGEASKELIEKFIANPLNPGINHIFNFIFNLFAWIPFSLAALIMPSANKQILPATPFLLGSTMIGYMSLGAYTFSVVLFFQRSLNVSHMFCDLHRSLHVYKEACHRSQSQ